MADEPNTPVPAEQPGPDGTDKAREYLAKLATEMEAGLTARIGNAAGQVIAKNMEAFQQNLAQIAAKIPDPGQIAQKAADLVLAQIREAQTAQAAPAPATAVQVYTGASGPGPAAGPQPLPANKSEALQMIALNAVNSWISDPVKFASGFRAMFGGTMAQTFDPKTLSLAQIDSLWAAKPDECLFIAQKHMPDPVMDIWPQESAKIYNMAWAAAHQAMRSAWRYKGRDPAELPEIEPPESLPGTSIPARLPPKHSNGSINGSESDTGPATAPASATRTRLRLIAGK